LLRNVRIFSEIGSERFLSDFAHGAWGVTWGGDMDWHVVSQFCYTSQTLLGLILDSTGFAKPKVHAEVR